MSRSQLSIYNAQDIQAQAITNELFADFVEWVDRSEKTTRTYLSNFKQFIAWLKYSGITHPERKDIVNYRNWLLSEHDAIKLDMESEAGWSYRQDTKGRCVKIQCKANTVAQYLRSVKQFFKWTAANSIYPNITENIHTPKADTTSHKKDALQAEDVLNIEQSIKKHAEEQVQEAAQALKDTAGRVQRSNEQGKRLTAMYLLAVNAGLRTVELSRANIKDLETVNGQTYLYIYGKGRDEANQKKAIAPEVADAIREYIDCRSDNVSGNSPLFVSTGNRSGGKRIAPTTISTMLKKAMKEAGYNSDKITAHSLRHTAGTNVMQISGHNIYDTQKYMRHKNTSTTEIYTHVNNEKQDAALARDLYNFYHGKSNTEKRETITRMVTDMSSQELDRVMVILKAVA